MCEYYIRNKHTGFLGNSPFWYGKNHNGYTAYILGAMRFSKEDAEEMVKESPDKWEMYNCDHVDERLHLVFDNQDQERLGTNEPCGWFKYADLSSDKRIRRAQEMLSTGDASISADELMDKFLSDVAQIVGCCEGQEKQIELLKYDAKVGMVNIDNVRDTRDVYEARIKTLESAFDELDKLTYSFDSRKRMEYIRKLAKGEKHV